VSLKGQPNIIGRGPRETVEKERKNEYKEGHSCWGREAVKMFREVYGGVQRGGNHPDNLSGGRGEGGKRL